MSLKALNESIEHWERLVKYCKDGNIEALKGEKWESNACALCAEYLEDENGNLLPEGQLCIGCPVHKYSGHTDCICTPWAAADTALENYTKFEVYQSRAIIGATRELNFLKMLKDTYYPGE